MSNYEHFVARQYKPIEVGDRGEFGMWNENHVPGIVESIHINHAGVTRVIFKRDGYRETFNVSSEHFVKWFRPAEFDAHNEGRNGASNEDGCQCNNCLGITEFHSEHISGYPY